MSATVFEIFTVKDRKLLILPTPPLFDAPLGENPLEFSDEIYPTKTRGMGLLYGENFIIPILTFFSMIHPCDGHTDGRAIAYRAKHICYMLLRANKTVCPITTWSKAFGLIDLLS